MSAFAHKLPRAHYFRAFRGQREIDVSGALDLDDAINDAISSSYFAHKDTLIIHEIDDGRRKGTLHAYAIRKKAATYRRDPTTGRSERVEPLYPDLLFSLPVDQFEPTRPFDALRDHASGIDTTLVEG